MLVEPFVFLISSVLYILFDIVSYSFAFLVKGLCPNGLCPNGAMRTMQAGVITTCIIPLCPLVGWNGFDISWHSCLVHSVGTLLEEVMNSASEGACSETAALHMPELKGCLIE